MTANGARGFISKVPLVSPERRIVGVVAGCIWVAPAGEHSPEKEVHAFDVVSGETRGHLQLAGAVITHETVDGVFVRTSWNGREPVEAFDLAERRKLFSKNLGAIVSGAAPGRLIATQKADGKARVLLLDVRSGEQVHSVSLPTLGAIASERVCASGRFAAVLCAKGVAGIDLHAGRLAFELPLEASYVRKVAFSDGDLFVTAVSYDEVTLARIDVAAGRVAWTAKLTRARIGDGISAIRVRRARLHVVGYVERAYGPALLVNPIDRKSGTLDEVRERRGTFSDIPSGAFDEEPPIPRAQRREREVAFWRNVDGVPVETRLPLPGSNHSSAIVDLETHRLFVLGRDLIGIDIDSIPSTPTAGLALTNVGSTQEDVPATVTFVGETSVVMLKHPIHGVTRIMRSHDSPQLAIGDQVILEKVTVLPGGVVRVGGWRPVSVAAVQGSAEIVLTTADLPPVARTFEADEVEAFFEAPQGFQPSWGKKEAPVAVAEGPPLQAFADPLERLFGETLPLFRRFASACDASPRARAWWNEAAPTFDSTPYEAEVEEVADVLDALQFVPFANDGLSYYGLVRDRATGASGVAVLSVEGDGDISWVADSFDGWLAATLRDSAAPRSIVQLLLESVSLSENFLEAESSVAPPWFERLTSG